MDREPGRRKLANGDEFRQRQIRYENSLNFSLSWKVITDVDSRDPVARKGSLQVSEKVGSFQMLHFHFNLSRPSGRFVQAPNVLKRRLTLVSPCP